MQFGSCDSPLLLCCNQRDNLRISEFERSCVQEIALYGRALNLKYRLVSQGYGFHTETGDMFAGPNVIQQ